jgi:hypothetical protein
LNAIKGHSMNFRHCSVTNILVITACFRSS